MSLSLQHALFGRRYVERRIDGAHLLLDVADKGLHRDLLTRGYREPEQRFLVAQHLQPGMRAFDLGANIGYYTLLMSQRVGDDGWVYAVEPHPDNYALLRHNLASNAVRNVIAEQIAVADHYGAAALLLADRCNWHSLHDPSITTASPWKTRYRREMRGSLPVNARHLAAFLADKPPLDLLRMDLEGYEVEILRALAQVPYTQTRKLHILFETHPEFYHPQRHDMRAVLQRLHERHGYEAKCLISDFHHGSRHARDIAPAASVFASRGYGARHIVKAFDNRAIYSGVAMADAIELICTSENVHAAFLAPGA